MALISKKNNAFSKVATVGGIDASTNPVTFAVTTGDGAKFPSSNFKISIDNEILLCTSRTGDSLTCARAQESTTIAAHTQNADVELRITAGTLEEYDAVLKAASQTSEADNILLKEQADPTTTPSAGYKKIYADTDDKLYTIDDAGVAKQILQTGDISGGNNTSLFKQALINGNFDVWQRGTSFALTAADGYTADRWYAETATATTDKTISQQDGTGVNGSRYCLRYLAAQDIDALNTLSQALESQDSIKFRGKKVTLSFYARGGAEFVADNPTLVSKIVTGKGTDQKVLAFTTSADAVSQNNTLTTGWVKYTCTTSAVIASDITQLGVSFAFTHAGAGVTTNYFEVTQVQLCSGDTALDFMPKSFEEELRACQRYYEKSFPYATTPAQNVGSTLGAALYYNFGTVGGREIFFEVRKRTTVAPTTYNPSVANENWRDIDNNADRAVVAENASEISFIARSGSFSAGAVRNYIHWAVDAEI